MISLPTFLAAVSFVARLGHALPADHDLKLVKKSAYSDVRTDCQLWHGSSMTNPTDFLFELGNTTDNDFADPRIMYHDGMYYAYSTNNWPTNKTNVPIAYSSDFRTGWSYVNWADAFPYCPTWAALDETNTTNKGSCNIWDPFVSYYEDGDHFVMYYAGGIKDTDNATQTHCIGIAISKSSLGPFIAQNETFICTDPVSVYNSHISPEITKYNGSNYVVSKHGQGYAVGVSAHLQLAELDSTGTKIISDQVYIYNSTIEDNDAEGPNIVVSPDGIFFLFFVTGNFTEPGYGIRYITSTESIWGPYDLEEQVLFDTGVLPESNVYLLAPGGPSFVNATHMMFMTTYPQNAACEDNGNNVRGPRVAKLEYNGRHVKLAETWD